MPSGDQENCIGSTIKQFNLKKGIAKDCGGQQEYMFLCQTHLSWALLVYMHNAEQYGYLNTNPISM